MEKLAIIIPAHNEAQTLPQSMPVLIEVIEKLSIETKICIVDDGSNDGTWESIVSLSKQYEQIQGLQLSKNFGKDNAILAGLEAFDGDYFMVADADNEHPYELIPKFVETIRTNQADVVHGVKLNSGKKSIFYRLNRKLFNLFFSKLTSIDLIESSDYKLMNKRFAQALTQFGDYDYFFRAIANNIGFKSSYLEFKQSYYREDTSKWTTRALYRYGLNGILSFSHAPIYFILILGIATLILSLLLLIKITLAYFQGNTPEGYATLITLNVLSMSVITICLGIIGLYVAKIHKGINRRPRYIIRERV